MDTTPKKFIPTFKGPYVVHKVLGNDRYVIRDIDNYQRTQLPYDGILEAGRLRKWVDADKVTDPYVHVDCPYPVPSIQIENNTDDWETRESDDYAEDDYCSPPGGGVQTYARSDADVHRAPAEVTLQDEPVEPPYPDLQGDQEISDKFRDHTDVASGISPPQRNLRPLTHRAKMSGTRLI